MHPTLHPVLRIAAVLVAAATSLAHAQPKQQGTVNASTAVKEIRALNTLWQSAVDAKDARRSAAMYAKDAVFMMPNAPKATGAGIQKAWENLLATPGGSLKVHPVNIVPSADATMAYDVGTYEFRFDGPKGRQTDRGKYLVVWQKVGGAWKVAADIFNSDLPAAK